MGCLLSLLKLAVKLTIVLLGTIFLEGVAAFILGFVPLPDPVRGAALGASALCFFAAMLVLVFGRSVRGMKWPVLAGFGLVVAVLLAGGFLATASFLASNPDMSVLLLGNLVAAVLLLLATDPEVLRALDLQDRHPLITAVEVHLTPDSLEDVDIAATTPEDRVGRLAIRGRGPLLRYVLFFTTITDTPLGLRLYRLPGGHIRLFLFTWASDNQLLSRRHTRLLKALTLYLPGATLTSHSQLPSPPVPAGLKGAPSYLTGIPSYTARGLTALIRTLASESLSAYGAHHLLPLEEALLLFQVTAEPRTRNWLDRLLARRMEGDASKAKKLLATAIHSDQVFSPDDSSRRGNLLWATRSLRRLRRLRAPRLLETRVALACWHPASFHTAQLLSRSLAEQLASALQPPAPEAAVTTHTPLLPSKMLRRLLRGAPTGSPTLLLPEEAAAYFDLPPI